jgi:NAD(P)-dependent dehydrogenase (short-subunit alcohol dehydrogenase family)
VAVIESTSDDAPSGRRLLVVGGDDATVDQLLEMRLAPEVASVRRQGDRWVYSDGERAAPADGVEQGVRQWLNRRSWAVVVAPGPLAEPDLSAAVAAAALTANLTVCRDASRAVARGPAGLGRLVFVTWALAPGERGDRPLLHAVAGAVGQLGRALATELGPRRITVNTVGFRSGALPAARDGLLLVLDPGSSYLTGEILAPSDQR